MLPFNSPPRSSLWQTTVEIADLNEDPLLSSINDDNKYNETTEDSNENIHRFSFHTYTKKQSIEPPNCCIFHLPCTKFIQAKYLIIFAIITSFIFASLIIAYSLNIAHHLEITHKNMNIFLFACVIILFDILCSICVILYSIYNYIPTNNNACACNCLKNTHQLVFNDNIHKVYHYFNHSLVRSFDYKEIGKIFVEIQIKITCGRTGNLYHLPIAAIIYMEVQNDNISSENPQSFVKYRLNRYLADIRESKLFAIQVNHWLIENQNYFEYRSWKMIEIPLEVNENPGMVAGKMNERDKKCVIFIAITFLVFKICIFYSAKKLKTSDGRFHFWTKKNDIYGEVEDDSDIELDAGMVDDDIDLQKSFPKENVSEYEMNERREAMEMVNDIRVELELTSMKKTVGGIDGKFSTQLNKKLYFKYEEELKDIINHLRYKCFVEKDIEIGCELGVFYEQSMYRQLMIEQYSWMMDNICGEEDQKNSREYIAGLLLLKCKTVQTIMK